MALDYTKESLLNPHPKPNDFSGKNIFRESALGYEQLIGYYQQAINRSVDKEKKLCFLLHKTNLQAQYAEYKQKHGVR